MADGGATHRMDREAAARDDDPGAVLAWHAALLARARSGDLRAFERLYRETSADVYGICVRMTRDPAAAEDCTQETYLRAWRSLAGFEARSRLTTWLHRIAVNVVLERRRTRAAQALEFVAVVPEPGLASAVHDTPVEEAEIEAAVASLPDGARDALVLCAIHGYSHAEAAAMLGLAEGTCKAQLHRARQLLRERLEPRHPATGQGATEERQ